jgi:hypothetical protein
MEGTLVKERFVTYKEFKDDDIVLSLRELTEQKYDVKSELEDAERRYNALTKRINKKKEEILFKTDFKSKGITNQQGRTSYANNKVNAEQLQLDLLKKEVDEKRLEYSEVSEDLSNYKLMINLEISRRGM